MPSHPLFFVGVALFFVGFLLFAGVLFSHGGVARSRQFRVMGELFSGKHGNGARLLFASSFLVLVAGACLLFAGVAASDGARAERCESHCHATGYERARIGPNSDRTDDRATWWVACICEGGTDTPSEVPADSL